MTWIKKSRLVGILAALTFPAFILQAQQPAAEMQPEGSSTIRPVESRPEEKRPVESIYCLEIGGARDISTYLSPLYYEGLDLGLSASWTKKFQRWPDRCTMRFEGALNAESMLNPAKSARMLAMTARFNWGLLWRNEFSNRWQMTLGPMLDIYGGALYLTRNGNNPVTALASAGLDIAGSLAYRFRIGRFNAVVGDEVRIPSISAFFSPAYGETYYEIYLGNHRGLAHCGWWGNAWALDNLLSFKINFGKTGMLVGYRFDLRTFRENHLQTQVMRNAFVIGVIPNGF